MKTKTVFVCTECGNESPKWNGKCPACGAYLVYEPEKDKLVCPFCEAEFTQEQADAQTVQKMCTVFQAGEDRLAGYADEVTPLPSCWSIY